MLILVVRLFGRLWKLDVLANAILTTCNIMRDVPKTIFFLFRVTTNSTPPKELAFPIYYCIQLLTCDWLQNKNNSWSFWLIATHFLYCPVGWHRHQPLGGGGAIKLWCLPWERQWPWHSQTDPSLPGSLNTEKTSENIHCAKLQKDSTMNHLARWWKIQKHNVKPAMPVIECVCKVVTKLITINKL